MGKLCQLSFPDHSSVFGIFKRLLHMYPKLPSTNIDDTEFFNLKWIAIYLILYSTMITMNALCTPVVLSGDNTWRETCAYRSRIINFSSQTMQQNVWSNNNSNNNNNNNNNYNNNNNSNNNKKAWSRDPKAIMLCRRDVITENLPPLTIPSA